MKNYTLQELQPLILEWANEKDLLKSENAPKQRLKLLEEVGETASAILKNKPNEIKDGIGDIFVVLIILAEQLNSDLDLEFKERESKDILFFINSITDYARDNKNNLYFSIQYLNGLSIELNYDLEECANLAWNEIKDRTGKNVNGTFIKD